MKKTLFILFALLMTVSGAWAQITVSPSTGVYWKNGAETTDAWAPIWKSNAKAADFTTPMLVLTGETGMNTANGDIYSNQTYTLTAPEGYTIVSYTFNGTATDGDVTITPNGGSGTTISNGNSLSSPLAVTVGAQSTTFALSGNGHISSLALTVKVEHYIVTYSTSTGSYTTTTGNYVNTWNSTATDPQVTFAVSGGANNIEKSTGYIFSGANGCTYVLTAQGGYIITGYEIVGTAQTAAQTLTPAAGGSETTFATTGTTTLSVSGLSTQSTSFTQSKPNNGIAISSFKIFLEKDPCTITYKISDASGVIYTSDPMGGTAGETITTLPSSIQRPYCTYTVTPTNIVAGTNTVNATVTYDPPFTVSSSFNDATWYYATLRGKQLRADESHKDGNDRYQTNSTNERTDVYKWAFVGNPYNLSIINKGAGASKVLYAGNVPVMQAATPASDVKARWIASQNSNGGFTFRSESGANLYINDAGNGGNLGYWNSSHGANDAGSNWVIEEVNASDKALLADAITAAQTLVDGAGNLGYINSSAASALSSAITTAQNVYNDASGDYVSAYNALADAITTASAPANINYTPRTDVYYTIVNARGAMVYDASHSSSVDTQNDNAEYIWYGSTTPEATNPNNLWGFIERDGKYYMYNVGKRQFASVGHGTYGNTWIFSNTPAYITLDDGIANEIVPPGVRVRATIATTGTSYTMSVSTNYTGPVITYDANGDGGVPMVFAESSYAVDEDVTAAIEELIEDVTPYRNALKDVIDACALLPIGNGLNQYSSNSTYTDALAAANTAYNNESATKSDLQTAMSDLESAIAGLQMNKPADGSFLRIRSVKNGMGYINAETTAVQGRGNVLTVGSQGKSSIYYYKNGKLLSYSCGQYFIKNSNNFASLGETGTDGAAIVFGTGTKQKGTYTVQFGGRYLYAGNNATETNAANGEADNNYDFWLEQVTELPVTISASGWATFYAPVAVTIPSGVTAYTATVSGTELTKVEVPGTTIPAGTGVLLYADINEATTYNFDVAEDVTAITGNAFTGTTPTINKPSGDVYVLAKGSSGLGFYKYAGTTLAGFKAYIPASALSTTSASFIGFADDDITAVDAVIVNGQILSDQYYDLQGRKVVAPQKGQLYIHNGKKVLY